MTIFSSIHRSYKITPRSQNAHAYVNAAFLVFVDADYNVLSLPNVVYGGIRADFVHAEAAEQALFENRLDSQETLNNALSALDFEVLPEENDLLASAEYRKHLTKALLYKV